MTMSLVILGVAFPVLLLSPMTDARRPFLNDLRHVSVVGPRVGGAVEPEVMAPMKTHPAVSRVISSIERKLVVSVPPVNQSPVRIHGAQEQDLQAMLDTPKPPAGSRPAGGLDERVA